MALSTYPDCGKDISTQARSCPICGAPRRKHASITGRVLLILAVLVGVPGLILTVGLDFLASVNAVPPSNAYTVTYRVYGIMSGANVTYYNAQGGIPARSGDGAVGKDHAGPTRGLALPLSPTSGWLGI